MSDNPYRKLPQVARVLDAAPLAAARAAYPPDAVAAAVRAEVEILRIRLDSGEPSDGLPTVDEVARRAAGRLETDAAVRLRPVINATGIVLHTNLGRSPLAESAAKLDVPRSRGHVRGFASSVDSHGVGRGGGTKESSEARAGPPAPASARGCACPRPQSRRARSGPRRVRRARACSAVRARG